MSWVAISAAVLAVGGCKVVSIAEDKAMRERSAASFDADRYIDSLWADQALPFWAEREQPMSGLLPQIRSGLDAVGQAHGRQAGDGSPWTFAVAGEGVVQSIQSGRRARAVVLLDGSAERVVVQIGPVVSGAALRDSLPFIQFNDFANQLVYADVAQALTRRALTQTGPQAEGLAPGDRLAFRGVAPVLEAGDEVVVTPYALTRGAS